MKAFDTEAAFRPEEQNVQLKVFYQLLNMIFCQISRRAINVYSRKGKIPVYHWKQDAELHPPQQLLL